MSHAPWKVVEDFKPPAGWQQQNERDRRAREYCEALERGQILFFPIAPFEISPGDREFLLAQPWAELRVPKTVSYHPPDDRLRGVAGDPATISRIQAILRGYSRQVAEFAGKFLLPYAGNWTIDLATFRPFAEERRGVPLHRRSDLLHVNVSTSRPTRGSRILRVFTNLSPEMPRVWQVAEATFESLARQYAQDAGLLRIAEEASYADAAGDAADKLGLRPASRTPFDMFMLRFQDYMKENAAFQRSCSKVSLEFPPLATWMVFTDSVAHAAISGRNEIEQTFLIPPGALVAPEHAPIRILESLAGYSLTA